MQVIYEEQILNEKEYEKEIRREREIRIIEKALFPMILSYLFEINIHCKPETKKHYTIVLPKLRKYIDDM